MLFIIAHHFVVHTSWNAEGKWAILSADDLNVITVFFQCLSVGGKWTCCVFALLTGYFTVKSRVHYKRIANLIAQMCFYSWTFIVLIGILHPQSLSLRNAFTSLFPFLYDYWFCVWYILFSLFIPFVNRLLHDLSKQEHEKLACILIVVWALVPSLTYGWADQGYLMMFLTMYVIGAYIQLYAPGSRFERLPWKRIALLCFALLYISVPAMDACGTVLKINLLIAHAPHFASLNSIITVACAVSIFMVFRQMEFHNTWINRVSGSMLGIYLIHENVLIRPLIWNEWFPNAPYVHSPWLPVFAAAKVAVIFVVCLLLDKGREWLFRHSVDRWLDALWARHAIRRADQQASV